MWRKTDILPYNGWVRRAQVRRSGGYDLILIKALNDANRQPNRAAHNKVRSGDRYAVWASVPSWFLSLIAPLTCHFIKRIGSYWKLPIKLLTSRRWWSRPTCASLALGRYRPYISVRLDKTVLCTHRLSGFFFGCGEGNKLTPRNSGESGLWGF